jgi:hypothetical protein
LISFSLTVFRHPLRRRGGDIASVYAGYGAQSNIQPVLDLLIRYASPEDKQNTIDFLMLGAVNPKRQANFDWLLKRLKE